MNSVNIVENLVVKNSAEIKDSAVKFNHFNFINDAVKKMYQKFSETPKAISREEYLAYAFLRGKKYRDIEQKINEDNFPEGRKTFFSNLAYYIAIRIVQYMGGDIWNSKSFSIEASKHLQGQIVAWLSVEK